MNMLPINEALIVTFLRQRFSHISAIYIFGSQAQGTADKRSDVDLAVLVDESIDPLFLWETAEQLAIQLNCDVDLIDLRMASTVMQYQIVLTGRCIWEKGTGGRIYESFICNEKLALDTLRAGILSDIKTRGSVYGG